MSLLLGGTFALVRIEMAFAQTQRFRCDFEQLIVLDKIDGLFKAEIGVRC